MADEFENVLDEFRREMRGVRDELTRLRTLALIDPCDEPAKPRWLN